MTPCSLLGVEAIRMKVLLPFAVSSGLKIKAIYFSKTLATTYQIARCRNHTIMTNVI
jgi:hypothetical protein